MQPYPECGFPLDNKGESTSVSRSLPLPSTPRSLSLSTACFIVVIELYIPCRNLFRNSIMASLASAAIAVALLAMSGARAGLPVTCSNPQLSCQNTTVVSNTCCFNAPGGQLVQTQFWDTSPSTGISSTISCSLSAVNRP